MTGLLRKAKSRGKFFYILLAIILANLGFYSIAYGISRGYQTDDSSLKPGMVVGLRSDTESTSPIVEAATEDNLENIIGVATTIKDSSITVASSGQTVFVESQGEVKAYASDLNSQVKQGDQLTLSPLNGILTAANAGSQVILGTALEDFPTTGLEAYEINTDEGKKTTNIALMRINLDTKLVGSSRTDSSLERLGKSVAGRDVSEVRVIVAMVIFLLVLFAEGGILYGSTSSAVTSLGRNPLAGRIIRRQLIQVMIVAFGVLAVGLTSIYLILWV